MQTKEIVPKLNLTEAGLIEEDESWNILNLDDNFFSDSASDFDDIMEHKPLVTASPPHTEASFKRQNSYVVRNSNGTINTDYQDILPTPRFEYQDILPTPRLDPVEFTGIDEIPDGICPAPPPTDPASDAMDALLSSIPPPPPATFDIDIPDADLPDHQTSIIEDFGPKLPPNQTLSPVHITRLQNNVTHPRSDRYKYKSSAPAPSLHSNHTTKFMKALKANEEILTLDGIMVEEDYIPVTPFTDSPEQDEKRMPWDVCMSQSWQHQPVGQGLKRQESALSDSSFEDSVVSRERWQKPCTVKKHRGNA